MIWTAGSDLGMVRGVRVSVRKTRERQQKLKKGELDASGVLPVIDVEG